MRREFLLVVAGITFAAGVGVAGYGANERRQAPEPIPNTRAGVYHEADDQETLMYIHDTSAILQREHQEILETLDQIKGRLDALEKKIESSKKP